MVNVSRSETLFVVSPSDDDGRSVPEMLRREREALVREIEEVSLSAQKALHGDGDPETYLRHAHTQRLLETQLASLDRVLGLP